MKKTLKKFIKYAGLTVGGLTAATATLWYILNSPITNKNLLTPQDFNNAEWIEIYNRDGMVWEEYMNENIPHNTFNWGSYQTHVKEKNPSLEGTILLPDLDGNGFVGEVK